jgi:hypothetical protein
VGFPRDRLTTNFADVQLSDEGCALQHSNFSIYQSRSRVAYTEGLSTAVERSVWLLCHSAIEHDTVLIHRAPKIMLYVLDANEHFVQVPLVPLPLNPALIAPGTALHEPHRLTSRFCNDCTWNNRLQPQSDDLGHNRLGLEEIDCAIEFAIAMIGR